MLFLTPKRRRYIVGRQSNIGSAAMTLIIRLSDEQAQALEARAADEGLSVEQWLQKLAESGNKPAQETRTGADLITALQASP